MINRILLFLFSACCLTSVQAQVLLQYGDGEIDYGFGTSGQILTSYVLFPVAYAKPYENNQITKVRIGMHGPASNVTLYFKENQRDSKPLYTQKVTTLEAGWNEVTLTTPFDITGKKSIAIGYKATLDENDAIGCSAIKASDGDYVYINQSSRWTNTGTSLCIQALVEGASMPENELMLSKLTDQVAPYEAETMTFSGTVRNMGVNAVESYELRYTFDDGEVQTLSGHPLALNALDTFSVVVPATAKGVHLLKVWIHQVNGSEDSYADNNTAEARLTVKDIRFKRRVVCEENTGLWCGWCPRGMVGLELMKERHPDSFFAVSVHGGDVLEIDRTADYSYAPFTDSQRGAPSCMVNRRLSGDPFYDIENLYNMESAAENHIAYEMTAQWNSDSTMLTMHSRFWSDIDIDSPQYYAAYIVTEDSVTGYTQTNYYANTPDQEFYGWEKKGGSTSDCYFNDLARGIYGSYEGQLCSPKSMSAETAYTYEYTLQLPPTVLDKRQVHVIGVIIDHATGYIANAAYATPLSEQELHVDDVKDGSRHLVSTVYYDLSGRRLQDMPRGLSVRKDVYSDGEVRTRKMMIR